MLHTYKFSNYECYGAREKKLLPYTVVIRITRKDAFKTSMTTGKQVSYNKTNQMS